MVNTFLGVLTNQIPSNAIELPARKVRLAWERNVIAQKTLLTCSSNYLQTATEITHSFVKDWHATLHAIY
jgi:hypothetical protein